MTKAELIAQAAQAVVERWDTPLWKDAPATAEYINRLRAALRAEADAAGDVREVVASQRLREVFKPRPVNGTLDDYWSAIGGEGPRAYEWADKPHRLVYDLIANVLYYTAPPPDERIATLTRELAEARLEITALTLVNKMRPAPQADMVPAEELAEARAEVERLKVENDALAELNHAQFLALENCRLLAARHRNEEAWKHILRFCDEGGIRAVHVRQFNRRAADAVFAAKRDTDAAINQARGAK